mgnify:CR=1 FL=1
MIDAVKFRQELMNQVSKLSESVQSNNSGFAGLAEAGAVIALSKIIIALDKSMNGENQ